MLIAHLADAHLGFRQYHRQTAAGINQREVDVAQAFRRVVDDVIAARPDAVLVAGDLFHAVRPTNTAIVFAFRQFQRLREALPQAPIVVIAGNHDTPRSSETGSILTLLDDLGIDVASDAARRLEYPALDLSVLAVPHAALFAPERPVLEPHGGARRQVLVIHGEVEGVFPSDRSLAEFGGATLARDGLARGGWSYVALGHYHVQTEVAPRIWYSGALEYVSPNPWGELREEARSGQPGKGWLLVDPDSGRVERHAIELARMVLDLEPIEAAGLAAEALQAGIAARIATVPGGIRDRVVRLVVRDVPRHVGRSLDHERIRRWKVEALHLHLDLRPPRTERTAASGAPGTRQTLPEVVTEFLRRRPLPAEVSRERFVQRGSDLVTAVEREAAEE